MKNSDKAHRLEENFKWLIALVFSYFNTHYQTELKDGFCLLLCKLNSILNSTLETIAGDLSILLLIYLCSPLFNGLKICKAHSMEEVCTSPDGMCGCAHIRQREKLLSACNEPNYPNSFAESFFFPLLLSFHSLNNIKLRFQVLGFQ